MELPTYTNIWKIEKRLYKLYDFRLPMPLPVGQVASFLLIAVPYAIVLAMAGAPFSHTWLWVYVLPPAVLAWLVTRPVLEGKRLHELLFSQLRYLSEPRTWCRMVPLREMDEIAVVASVWRSCPQAASVQPEPVTPAEQVTAAEPVPAAAPAAAGPSAQAAEPAKPTGRPAPWPAPDMPSPASLSAPSAGNAPVGREPARDAAGAHRPVVTAASAAGRPVRVVERVLRGSPGNRGDRVVAVPGGHQPEQSDRAQSDRAQSDRAQSDRARARQPIPGPARVVVLGCTASAGQTVTTLLAGQVLATLRGEPVAVLDLNPGGASLTEQAKAMPRLLAGRHAQGRVRGSNDGDRGQGRGLQVVTAGEDCQQDAGSLIDAAAARFPLVLADPAARDVPACLQVADQLVLVAPASADAAGSLAMTLEWLGVHDHDRLASAAIIVLTGVSPPSAQHVDKAAAVASGRCRAIVRVPWDERLAAVAGPAATSAQADPRPLGAEAVRAYTALAAVLVSALADADTTAVSPR